MYPAYITWEHYLANQERLQNNQNRYEQSCHGAPRQGQALLQGIVLCARCGSRMCLRYNGPQGQYPAYRCARARDESNAPRCQEAQALAIDAAVERQLLEALTPDRLAVALSAMEQVEQEGTALRHQWQLRLERARYEAEKARRKFNAVEPENRLVARNLERQWECHLREVEKLEQAYQRWMQQHGCAYTEADRAAILALGEDLPKVWNAATTTSADRKRLLRLIITSVVVDARRERGRLWYRINWQTGATTEQWLTRHVHSYDTYALTKELQERVRTLNEQGKTDTEIAAELNAEGLLTAGGQRFSSKQVWMLRHQWKILTAMENGNSRNPVSWSDGTYSIAGAAARIGVTSGTIYTWVHTGRIQGQQRKSGTRWKLALNECDIVALKQWVQHPKRSKKEAL